MATTSDVDVRIRLRGARIFNAQVSRSAAELEAFGLRGVRSLQRFSAQADKLRSFGRTMSTHVTLPIVAVGALAGKAAIDFEKSMRNVNSIAQLPERQLKSLSDSVLDLAGKTAQQPKTLADGLYDIVSSGFQASDALKILDASAQAATAGLTTTDISTRAVTAVLNAYHLSAERAGNVSDTLFETVNRGVISFEELASTIGDVLPFAQGLGVPLGDVGASISTMTKAGIPAAETMTRIKNVMVTLMKPGEELAKRIKQLGFENAEAMLKQLGFQGALDKLAGSTDGSKAAIAALFPNIRALGGVLALTGDNSKVAGKDLKAFSDVGGATSTALSEQSKSIAFQWNKLKAEATALAIDVAPKFMDALRGILGRVKDLVEWFSKLSPGTQQTIIQFLILAAALGPLIWMLGNVATGAGFLIRILAGGIGAVSSVVTFFRIWFTAMAAGQGVVGGLTIALEALGISVAALQIATGIGLFLAIAAALVVAYKKVKWFHDAVDAVVGFIKDHFALVASFFIGPVSFAIKWIIDHFGGIVDFFGDVLGKIRDVFAGAGQILKNIFDGPIEWIANKIEWLIDKINWARDHMPFADGQALQGVDISDVAGLGSDLIKPTGRGRDRGPGGGTPGAAGGKTAGGPRVPKLARMPALAGAGGGTRTVLAAPVVFEADGKVIAEGTAEYVLDDEARK